MIRRCDFCHRFRFGIVERTVPSGPGVGRIHRICPACLAQGRLPGSWYEQMGMLPSRDHDAPVKFMKYVGRAYATSHECGENAYGSVLAEYDDGSRIGVICEHGGSQWLCLTCAEKIMQKQEKEMVALTGDPITLLPSQ